jgi:hypothetical protein
MVAEANDAKASFGNEPASTLIGFDDQIMTMSVQFHDQHAAATHEIADIWADRHLTTELTPVELTGRQMTPERAFCRGCRSAEGLSL